MPELFQIYFGRNRLCTTDSGGGLQAPSYSKRIGESKGLEYNLPMSSWLFPGCSIWYAGRQAWEEISVTAFPPWEFISSVVYYVYW